METIVNGAVTRNFVILRCERRSALSPRVGAFPFVMAGLVPAIHVFVPKD
jgi:hypothetical protein